MNIIREYTQLSSLSKFAVGGSIGAAAVYAAASTNPVTIVGLIALGQAAAWLPDGIKKCFQRPAAPVVHDAVPAALPLRAPPARLPANNPYSVYQPVGLSEEQLMHWGMQNSMIEDDLKRGDPFEDDRKGEDTLARVKEQSLQIAKFEDSLREFKGFSSSEIPCKISEAVFQEEANIPDGLIMLSPSGTGLYNAAEFLIALLSRENPSQDALGIPISEQNICEALDLAGIKYQDFIQIWTKARKAYEVGGLTVEAAELARSNRSSFRLKSFFDLLALAGEKGALFYAYYAAHHPNLLKK